MNSWAQDVRYGLRMLGKAPGFTAVAVATLALGIGANTAIFSVANAVLLRPLPFADPGRLVLVTMAPAGQRSQLIPLSWLRYTLIHDQNRSFSGIAAASNETFNLSGRGDPEQIASARVSSEFFDVLGVRPAIGRTFLNGEDKAGGKSVVLISHSFWIRKMARAADVLGRHVTLDSRDYEIIGILPPAFQFGLIGSNIDLWAPRVFEFNLITPQQVQGGTGFLTAVARLRSGLTLDQAQAEMNALDRQYRQSEPGRPAADPIGKKVWPGRSPVAVVVGVMADVKNASLAADPSPEVFLPFPQLPWAHLNLSLRATTDPASLIPAVRRQISAIDKDQAVTGAQTLDDVLAASAAQRRSTMLLLGSFAATAFILAMVGIYGLVAYSVAQRSGELGIRIALGAARGDILRLVVGQGLVLTLSGIIVGVACSVGLTRLLSGMLYQTSATDPATLVLCAVLFTAVALAASYLPARRATRIDPTDALRSE